MGAAAAGDEMAAAVEGKEERIMVSVRLRPLNAKEAERGDSCDWECIKPTTIIFKNSLPDRGMLPNAYSFDRVFGKDCTTRQVYEEGAKEVALSVVSGINSSVFAYGQTSSGKTYTMTGITEYSVDDIYDYIHKHSERQFVLKFSAMEIYNEAVRDLLSTDSTPLRLLDDPEKGTVVEKLTEETLKDQDHLGELLSICEAQRQIGETALNEVSSRSHQILRLTIESSAREFSSRASSSKLVACVNFVDLAGSERASQAASAGVRLKEGSHINRSLLTLGKVIRQLSKGRNGHIPYRDSKLTRILHSSIGGNARTAIICTMSPAHSHIEQSRNTLLFATCAKEVVTNAKVNVVMSDKELVKRLQRELARLENELKFPGSASCSTHAEALKKKDAQIKKLEKELKELMEEKDLAQSRLDSLLNKGLDDDHGDDRILRQWDEFSQVSVSQIHNASEDALSTSETYGIDYQDQVFGSTVLDETHVHSSNVHFLEPPERRKDEHSTLFGHSPNSISSDGLDPLEMQELAFQAASEDEEHCKEVQCIEVNELSRSRSKDFSLLLPEETESFLPLTNADKLEVPEMELSVETTLQVEQEQQVESRILEKQVESIMKTIDTSVKPHPNEASLSLDLGSPNPDESLMSVGRKLDIVSSRGAAVTRSRSCRASLIVTSNNWFEDSENINTMPPDDLYKYLSVRPEKVRRSLYSQDNDYLTDRLSLEESVTSEKNISNEVSKAMSTNATEDVIISDISCVTGHQKPIEQHQQEQIHDDQTINEVEKMVRDVGIDTSLSTVVSPSRWPFEFEKKQQDIIELWQACNVSLLHRTYFFVLFKGDPADSVYMEVEHRRLSFLKNSLTGDPVMSPAGSELSTALASSLKNLRREREMLYRQMLKKLTLGERESLYTKWGIALNSKQRRLQLSRLIWTQTEMEHVRESASLVAKLIELVEPGQALKEMFGFSFTLTPQADRRSFSWLGAK